MSGCILENPTRPKIHFARTRPNPKNKIFNQPDPPDAAL
jgi:hypothetical protein